MCAVTHVQFTCSRILAQGQLGSLVMCPSFCTPLLRVSPFGIWHDSIFKSINYSGLRNFSSPFHNGFSALLALASIFFNMASTSGLQFGPPISSSLHIL